MLYKAGGVKVEELLKYNPLDLFHLYCPDASLDDNCRSPLRFDDNEPSFRLFWSNGTLFFNDFGLGEVGDIVKFVRLMYNLSYREALEKIYMDIHHIDNNISPTQYKVESGRSKSVIKFKARKPKKEDFEFWSQYLNDMNTLSEFKVFPISSFSINGSIIYCNSITYAFVIGSRIKIYQPYGKPKYLGNTNKNSIQGWDKLGGNVYLVSSLKEVLVLYEQGITAIAPNSESTRIEEHVISLIKQKAHVKILYDWDVAGLKNASVHSLLYGIEVSKLQYLETDVKDLSDYRKKYGFNKFKQLCEELKEH